MRMVWWLLTVIPQQLTVNAPESRTIIQSEKERNRKRATMYQYEIAEMPNSVSIQTR
ncbi:hypothetical protein FDUTEX481_01968 [Tolypothrix sp. PCC 7601]|uniref:hypothetical protein n=1 Tax=unclassified Tolypothrix TaxID=2649714 RepID=UPI0005EAC1AF|nr:MULTISPECIES: hypothetical protein [unclassified Tolypothrix]EKF04290.1 hypothetical protein FDUTEX481_01968 [Tolypothrix sp. PCC 7601]UYD32789.1 hypothetical protein HG267_27890 [Tolypothrix sp. PCC 7601]BAY90851.1 hypothetical protein NIES3275_28680 [Microchaete diplosiphon NIES-3275]